MTDEKTPPMVLSEFDRRFLLPVLHNFVERLKALGLDKNEDIEIVFDGLAVGWRSVKGEENNG